MHKVTRNFLPKATTIVAVSLITMFAGYNAVAVDVYTDPVGFVKVSVSVGATLASAPMHNIQTNRMLVVSTTANTVTVSGTTGWTPSTLGTADGLAQYILLVKKDASASPGVQGDWWTVTGNTATSVTLNVGVENLTTILGVGDQVEVRHLVTVKDICGPTNATVMVPDTGCIQDASGADLIRGAVGTGFGRQIEFIPDGNACSADAGYYLDGDGPKDGSTITFLPDEAFWYFRKAGSGPTNLLSIGQVQITQLTHYMVPGANAVGNTFPAGAVISTSGLAGSGWIGDTNCTQVAADFDDIRALIGTGFSDDIEYIPAANTCSADPGWYVTGNPNDAFEFAVGKGYFFFIKAPAALKWRQVVPFTP